MGSSIEAGCEGFDRLHRLSAMYGGGDIEDLDLLLDALQSRRTEAPELEVTGYEAHGGRAGDDRIRKRQLLQAGGDVWRVADNRHALEQRAAGEVACNDDAGVDAHPDLRPEAVPALELSPRARDPAHHLEPGMDRPRRVVLAGGRIPKIGENAVAHVARDLASELEHRLLGVVTVSSEELPQVLGIERPRHLGRSDEV